MQKEDCFLFGTIFKLHGYRGDVNIYNDIPFVFSKLDYFLIEIDNSLVPYFIERVRITKPNIVLVKFEDVNSEDEAKKIHKRKVYLPKGLLPKTNKKEISAQQLIGYSVIDIKMGDLGIISFVNSKTAQTLIHVEKDQKIFYFPWHKKFVRNIDTEERVIQVNIPKELLDLN